jgi:hypothetical protein
MVMPDEERRNTAYHEAGHALIGQLLPKCDPVHKVTIIPRGRALGVTMSLPAQDRSIYDSEYMLSQIAMGLGGRIAEELVLGDISSGAAGDIKQITKIARHMVCDWGMSPLGPVAFGDHHDTVFLGREITRNENISEETARKIDEEIHRIIAPGGYLSLAVPNYGGAQAESSGKHWFHLDIPCHFWQFRPAPLRRMIAQQGFKIVNEGTYSFEYDHAGEAAPGLPARIVLRSITLNSRKGYPKPEPRTKAADRSSEKAAGARLPAELEAGRAESK